MSGEIEKREMVRDIGERLLRRVLLQVSSETCRIHRGLLSEATKPTSLFDEDVEAAARAMKALGEGWEEYS